MLWIIAAIFSAVFAALTSVFAKVGISGVESYRQSSIGIDVCYDAMSDFVSMKRECVPPESVDNWKKKLK